MAFPGTYNINYYKGDTFEFRVYPKDSTGGQFLINEYNQFRFTISNVRGETAPAGVTKQTINGYAQISDDSQYILCAIKPENGAAMVAGTTYYYDVEIGKIASPYDFIYTLLQGTITVTDQITPPTSVPNPPQNVNIVFASASSGTISWAAPSGTSPVSYYNVYLLSPFVLKLNPVPIPSSVNILPVTLTAEQQLLLPPGTPITLGVTAENLGGESTAATISSSIPTGL